MTYETDTDILELAAKAAGLETNGISSWRGVALMDGASNFWNPLTDDCDALRLAVKLDIDIEQNKALKRSYAMWWGYEVIQLELFEEWGGNKHAATRRAIVRAAAEIGKTMK